MPPALDDFDLLGPGFAADPYPWYRVLRDQSPVHRLEADDLWLVSRYRDVLAVVRRPTLFSSKLGIESLVRNGLSARRPLSTRPPRHHPRPRILIASDPPEHTALRRILTRPFHPQAVAGLEPRIREVCEDLVDRLQESAARQPADLVTGLAEPLPVTVIADLLGVPIEQRADLKRWSDDLVGVLDLGLDPERGQRSAFEMGAFFWGMLEARQEAPGDDLVSLLAGEALSPVEIVTFCVLLLVAGNETTTNLITNAVAVLLGQPGAWDQLREEPGLAGAAVEEVLRYDAPVQGLLRQASEDCELAGTKLPAGARVLVLYGSANRDERRFPEPDRFDMARGPTDHLAFSHGPHRCLGAPLARLEGRIALEALLARCPDLVLASPGQRLGRPLLRGFRRLPVAC